MDISFNIEVFSERLKNLRLERGFSIETLAKASGLSSSSLSRFENNKQVPSIQVIFTMSSFFNVTTDYLVGRSDIKSAK